MEEANMTDYYNLTSFSSNVSGFSLYAVAWSSCLIFQTVIVISYQLCSFWPIRKVKNSFSLIFGTSLVSNLSFSLSATATSAVIVLIRKWNAGENLCLAFKYMQSFSLHLSSMLIIYVMTFHLPKDIVKTKLIVALLTLFSLFFSFSQILVYNSSRKPIEGPSFTCEEYGLFLKHELVVCAIFFGFPMILFGVIFAVVLNLNCGFKDNLLRRSIARPRNVININMSTRFVLILRNEKFISLYLKVIVILFHAIFWIIHHTVNLISAFLKQEVLGNQVNNSALLAFGNMVALTSPLLLKAFGERRQNRPVMRISSPEEQELRERNSSENMRRATSNILDITRPNSEASTQGTASMQISKSFESLLPGPSGLILHKGTNLKSKESVSVLAIKSIILLPTDVAIEESTPSTSTG